MIGQTVSGYRITARTSSGGMGEVYPATDTKPDSQVALKFLPESLNQDPEARQRLLHEAQVLIQRWRVCYNRLRPHRVLDYRPTAPEAVAPLVIPAWSGDCVSYKQWETGQLRKRKPRSNSIAKTNLVRYSETVFKSSNSRQMTANGSGHRRCMA